jgi:hypothetical protein
MPLYQLRPLSLRLDDADWGSSRHRLPCQVVAGSERRAREHAARLFSAPPTIGGPDDPACRRPRAALGSAGSTGMPREEARRHRAAGPQDT